MRTLIIGAGPSGLSTAWKLSQEKQDVIVVEKQKFVGGESTTFKQGKYLLDLGPHKIYTQDKEIMSFVKKMLDKELLTIKKKSSIILFDKFFDFPIRPFNLLARVSPLKMSSFMISYVKSMLSKNDEDNYENYLKNRFGEALYSALFKGYAEKVWGDPKKLSRELAESRVSFPNLFELVKRMIAGDKNKKELSAKEFYYPKKGIISLWEKISKEIKKNGGKVVLGREVKRIIKKREGFEVTLDNGKKETVDKIVSTVPLDNLSEIMETSKEIKKVIKKLKFNDLILVYLEVNNKSLFDDNWIFVPDQKYVFNRLFEQKNFSKYMAPEDKTILCAEVTIEKNEEKAKEKTKNQLMTLGIIEEKNVEKIFTKKVSQAYPVYAKGFRKKIEKILNYFDDIEGFYTIGKKGSFNYVGMLDCIHMGFTTAEQVMNPGDWKKKRESFNYVVID